MSIIERKQRQKDDTKVRIVTAALKIDREHGWNALSMRRIGEIIEPKTLSPRFKTTR